jgi:hypothetical protein
MDPDHLQTLAARDQLWSSLRALQPEIEQLVQGDFNGSERQSAVIRLLARIVVAELRFRQERAEPD